MYSEMYIYPQHMYRGSNFLSITELIYVSIINFTAQFTIWSQGILGELDDNNGEYW